MPFALATHMTRARPKVVPGSHRRPYRRLPASRRRRTMCLGRRLAGHRRSAQSFATRQYLPTAWRGSPGLFCRISIPVYNMRTRTRTAERARVNCELTCRHSRVAPRIRRSGAWRARLPKRRHGRFFPGQRRERTRVPLRARARPDPLGMALRTWALWLEQAGPMVENRRFPTFGTHGARTQRPRPDRREAVTDHPTR